MRINNLLCIVAIVCTATTTHVQAQVLERDPQNNFSISRPAAWINQERPSPANRVMLGIEGDGYVGNCNISVLQSPSTARLTQSEVDVNENKKPLGVEFFQPQLRAVAADVRVLTAIQTKRGPHFGHLVKYIYSYFSPSLQQRIHMHAELFSHSRAGKVLSFTCSTGALSATEAQRAFSKEEKSFEKLSASLRVNI